MSTSMSMCLFLKLGILATTFTFAHTSSLPPFNYVLIKHANSELVATQTAEQTVTVNTYKEGDNNQLWSLEPTLKGTFFIINKASGLALKKAQDSNLAVTKSLQQCKDQQWLINPEEKTIINAGNGRILDIRLSVYKDGTSLIVYKKKGTPNQLFVVDTV